MINININKTIDKFILFLKKVLINCLSCIIKIKPDITASKIPILTIAVEIKMKKKVIQIA